MKYSPLQGCPHSKVCLQDTFILALHSSFLHTLPPSGLGSPASLQNLRSFTGETMKTIQTYHWVLLEKICRLYRLTIEFYWRNYVDYTDLPLSFTGENMKTIQTYHWVLLEKICRLYRLTIEFYWRKYVDYTDLPLSLTGETMVRLYRLTIEFNWRNYEDYTDLPLSLTGETMKTIQTYHWVSPGETMKTIQTYHWV